MSVRAWLAALLVAAAPAAAAPAAAAPAAAQPADSVLNTMVQQPGPPVGRATGGAIVGPDAAPVLPQYGPPRPQAWERALSQEGGVFAGSGTAGVLLALPVQRRRLGASEAAGLSATAVLGVRRAAGGLFASAGIADGLTAAQVGAGVWAETSPRGRAFGPAIEARLRLAVLHAEAGAVVAEGRARWARVGLDLPLPIVGAAGPRSSASRPRRGASSRPERRCGPSRSRSRSDGDPVGAA